MDEGRAAGKTPHLSGLSAAGVQGAAHVTGEEEFYGPQRGSLLLVTAQLKGCRKDDDEYGTGQKAERETDGMIVWFP